MPGQPWVLGDVLVQAVDDEAVHVHAFGEFDPLEQVHCPFVHTDEAFFCSLDPEFPDGLEECVCPFPIGGRFWRLFRFLFNGRQRVFVFCSCKAVIRFASTELFTELVGERFYFVHVVVVVCLLWRGGELGVCVLGWGRGVWWGVWGALLCHSWGGGGVCGGPLGQTTSSCAPRGD